MVAQLLLGAIAISGILFMGIDFSNKSASAEIKRMEEEVGKKMGTINIKKDVQYENLQDKYQDMSNITVR